MKLSELIIDFRTRMNISQREFSRRCDLSNSYISFLENEKNPRTGKPIIPTIDQYKKLADGMGMTVHRLFELLDDDAPVDISSGSSAPDGQPRTPEARSLAKGLDKMPEEQRKAIMKMMIGLYPGVFEKGTDDHDA